MSTQQATALLLICDAIAETVQNEPEGVPGGTIYAALASFGCTKEQFDGIMSGLVATGRLSQAGSLYFAPTAIRLAPQPLPRGI